MASREQILRAGITKAHKIIEIGPSYNPLAPKSEGWRSYAVDHSDQQGLINKYRCDASVNVTAIEPVDFVWTKGALSEAVPAEHHGTFDVFLASHVLEHVPDLIGILRSAEVLCRAEAKMVLALPDKRVCFDFFRPLSTTGDVLAAHWERRSRHSAKTLWDHFAYAATKQGNPGWARTDLTELVLIHSLDEAANSARSCDSRDYVDAHAWTFVPASFSLIMLELAHLGLTDWQVERTEAAESTEFYVWLRRGALEGTAHIRQPDLAAERRRLLAEIALELRDQSRQVPTRLNKVLAFGRRKKELLDKLTTLGFWRADLNAAVKDR
jgi:Methyltransferase domain